MKIIRTILLTLLCLPAIVLLVSMLFINKSTQGIDVSHHNSVKWNIVASDTEIEFAFVKITEGSTFYDKDGKKNIMEAEKNGIKTGAYHYFSTGSSAEKQFHNFSKHYVKEASLVPMVDVEDFNDITMKDLNSKIKAFCELVENEYGVKPIIYTRPDLYYSVFMRHGFIYWSKYTFFFWQPIPVHPFFSTGRIRCLWQYSTNRDRIPGTSIIDKDILSLIKLPELYIPKD